jgi:molecular chaperone DnaK (HSP70)
VREKLSEIFPTIEKFNEKVNPDHAVAYGATVLAAQYAGIATRAVRKIANKNIFIY